MNIWYGRPKYVIHDYKFVFKWKQLHSLLETLGALKIHKISIITEYQNKSIIIFINV